MHIHFDISTFEGLDKEGDALIKIIGNILNELVLQQLKSLRVHFEKFDRQYKMLDFNENTWQEICNLLLKGEIQFLYIYDQTNLSDSNKSRPLCALSLTCDYKRKLFDMGIDESGKIPNNLAFSISSRSYNGVIPKEIQDKVVNLVKLIFRTINGVNAYITLSERTARMCPQTTKFEESIERYYGPDIEDIDGVIRGYFWGNILSEIHIEALGGIQKIKANSPFNFVEELTFGNRKAVYLQATTDISRFLQEDIERIKEFFIPITPEENE